ncbi:MAG: hydrogenase maturation protease [Actinobacteria bacterium]|nr:MAG: hydrogenase maturation protease [Actinomycetota bacterium]
MRYLIGIGNYHAGDDSIGLRIAEAIAEEGLDGAGGFTAIDLGGNLLDLVHYLGEDSEAVLVVDSARMGSAPGEYAFFTPEQVATRKASGGLSTHEGDLVKVLEFAEATGASTGAVTIMGIEPAEIRAEPGLSEPLTARFREYVDAAVAFLAETTRRVGD